MRILISVMPFAGHVAPVTGVVAELLARDHEVVVYSGSRYRERFTKLGADFVAWQEAPDFDEHDLSATFPAVGKPGPLGVIANIESLFIGTAPGQARDLAALIGRGDFDVVAADVMSYGAGLAADLTGLPWVTLSIVPLSWPSRDLPPGGLGLQPASGLLGRMRDRMLWAAIAPFLKRLDRSYTSARRAVGLAEDRPFAEAGYSPMATALTGAASVEFPRSGLPTGFEFVGRLRAAGSAPSPARAVRAGRPRVLVTQGTFNTDPRELIQPTLRALASDDVEVIVTTGRRGVHEIGMSVPWNARVVDFFDFATELSTVDLVVTNGGWGGTLEFLSAGVPLVVAGGDLDKPEVAARVAWSGAGIDLRTGRPSSASVGRAVRRILAEPSFGESATRIAADLATHDGVAAVAELIKRTGSAD